MEDSQIININTNEKFASTIVDENIAAYAKHLLHSQFPHCVDGLKPIHRRILVTLSTVHNKLKVHTLTGRVMQDFHPAADAAIADAIVRLAQPFNNEIPLVYIDGNVGMYAGGQPAAPRYIDALPHPFSTAVFFTGVNPKTLKYIPSETGTGVEPEYLIPRIPTALLMCGFGIAIGYRHELVPISLANICKLVERFIKSKNKNIPFSSYRLRLNQCLVPSFPCKCYIRNMKELLRSYDNGNYSQAITTDGCMRITPSAIYLKTLPYGTAIDNVYIKAGKEVIKKNTFFSDNFQRIEELSEGETEANIEFTLKRGTSPFKILTRFKDNIGFTRNKTPHMLFVDNDGKKIELNHLELLQYWYEERYRSMLSDLKHIQNKLVRENREINALIVVADHSTEIYKLFNSAKTPEDTIVPLREKFGLSTLQAKYLARLQFHQLTQVGKDALLKSRDENATKIKELQSKFMTIDQQILDDVASIKNTFCKDLQPKTMLSDFSGYVQINDEGIIQYKTPQDLSGIMKDFYSEKLSLYSNPNGQHYGLICENGVVKTDELLSHPRQFACDRYYTVINKPKWTLCLKRDRKNSSIVYRVKDLAYRKDATIQYTYVGDKCLAIASDGIGRVINSTDIVLRQNISAAGSDSQYIYLSDRVDSELVIVHANEREPNHITIELINNSAEFKLNKLLLGKTVIIGVWRKSDNVLFTIPEEVLSRCTNIHWQIDNLDALLAGKRSIKVQVSAKSVPSGLIEISRYKPIKQTKKVEVEDE